MRRRNPAWAVALLTAPFVLAGAVQALRAQAITTSTIAGVVRDDRARGVVAAQVRVVDLATGFPATSYTHDDGSYVVQGLPPGGPYSVTVQRIGFRPARRDSITLSLGQSVRLDFALQATATELAAVTVQAELDPRFSPGRTGAGSWVTDSALRRLPTVNRDLYAFVQLTPQIASWYGPSGGGVNSVFNSILIDGASEQALFGGNAAGAIWGGKPISIEAVKEYQVLLSPYDVRQGDFAGAQINAVTRNGTNDLQGTAFLYWRNESLARNDSYPGASPYDREQFGFTLGGPIIRDRIQFFVAGELQHLSAPALGPYVGQSPTSQPALRVDTADINRFVQLLQSHGLVSGSAGPVANTNPAANLFGRLDVALPRWNSRAVLRHNFSRADTNAFSRPTRTSSSCRGDSCFPLSSVGRHQRVAKQATVLQLFTNFRNGAYNEITVSRTSSPLQITPNVREPLIVVDVPNGSLQAGSVEFAQGNEIEQEAVDLAENLTLPVSRHRFTVGARGQLYRVRGAQVIGAYGVWRFSTLDSLQRDSAALYSVTKDLGSGDASIRGFRYGIYVGDEWQMSDRLALTFGVRADVPVVSGRPPYSPTVDSVFGRRTDLVPSGVALLSPRIGFNWTLPGRGRQQVRGGMGLFAGRPPLVWLLRAFQNYGDGLGSLHCGGPSGEGPPPPFPSFPDYRNPPVACANGTGLTLGPVDLLDRGLKYPQTLRISLGYDRSLPWDVVATLEGLYTKSLHDYFFVNRNLRGLIGSDRHGRGLYGSIGTTGVASPQLVDPLLPEVIELQHQSRNYAYNLTVQLDKRFSNRVEASVAYDYGRVRDVQSDRGTLFLDNWQFGRVLSGDQENKRVGISDFDQPHKLVIVATYTAPWSKWQTDVSFYYVGTSGVPYTNTAFGSGRGDLNADGSNVNDPIYVPMNGADTAEIRFQASAVATVAQQQQAFEQFIKGTPCLRRQRGRIMERNSCRSPWMHTLNAAVRQALPDLRGHTLSAELQIFNLLNLVNKKWGQLRLPNNPFSPQVGLLQQVGQTAGPASQAQPVFQFDPKVPRYNSHFPASNYQIQLAARFTF